MLHAGFGRFFGLVLLRNSGLAPQNVDKSGQRDRLLIQCDPGPRNRPYSNRCIKCEYSRCVRDA